MRHYTLVHTSAHPESPKVVCYSVWVSMGEESYLFLGEGIWLIETSVLANAPI